MISPFCVKCSSELYVFGPSAFLVHYPTSLFPLLSFLMCLFTLVFRPPTVLVSLRFCTYILEVLHSVSPQLIASVVCMYSSVVFLVRFHYGLHSKVQLGHRVLCIHYLYLSYIYVYFYC